VTAVTPEEFTPGERSILAPFFTNLDGPVFALVNLPEEVKGALFARYSRSPKPLRRLFLDEFSGGGEPGAGSSGSGGGLERARALYEKVFVEYGDDSVAQLGGVHLACEGVSNILTKVLERGRLMSYLEQSTRYIPYTDRPGGSFRYHVPRELEADLVLKRRFQDVMDLSFTVYAKLLDRMQLHFDAVLPKGEGASPSVRKRTVRARALDAVRGLLPAATRSNVGIFGTGQGYEAMLLRMRADPLQEVRECADRMLAELRKVIPAFMKRVDLPERGVAWSGYLRSNREAALREARQAFSTETPEGRPAVTLTDFDPDGELKVVAAALYAATDLPDDQILSKVRGMSAEARAAILRAVTGLRTNRRHRPGRAFERACYRFDILSDYGAFRDLQRHRLLTLEWQRLSTKHGYVLPEEIEAARAAGPFRRVMDEVAGLHEKLIDGGFAEVAPYAVSMAYRVRYCMEMNAREAMHVIELRTTPQGHPSYRRICQEMHRLIAAQAGHPGIAAAIRFADHSSGEEGRLRAEQASEARAGDADGGA
jgi:thymidylate synthase ThyX